MPQYFPQHTHHTTMGEKDMDRPMPQFADESKLPYVEDLEAMGIVSKTNLEDERSCARYDPHKHLNLDGSHVIAEVKSLADLQGEMENACICGGEDKALDEYLAASQQEPTMTTFDPEILNATMAPRLNSFALRRRIIWSSFVKDLETNEVCEHDIEEERIKTFHETRRAALGSGGNQGCIADCLGPCK